MTNKLKYREKIGQNGEIRIPSDYMKTLGLYPGGEVELELTGKRVLIEPVKETLVYKKQPSKDKDLVEALTGSLPLPPELIDEIVENEHLYESQGVD